MNLKPIKVEFAPCYRQKVPKDVRIEEDLEICKENIDPNQSEIEEQKRLKLEAEAKKEEQRLRKVEEAKN